MTDIQGITEDVGANGGEEYSQGLISISYDVYAKYTSNSNKEISAYQVQAYSCVTNVSFTSIAHGAYVHSSTYVLAKNLQATECARTKIGTMTVTFTNDTYSLTGSVTVDIYQEANVKT